MIRVILFLFQSMDKRDFSKGLRPEHAAGGPAVSRTVSESSQMGMNTPSLPATPVSPRSPLLNHRSPYGSPCTSPGPFRRSNSPRRQQMDVGFASAVTNICEQAHTIAEHDRREKYRGGSCIILFNLFTLFKETKSATITFFDFFFIFFFNHL